MPAEERRASILAATVPLLIAHGTQITTRQIAEAAGVAEGTIFRVFVDKETLIEAAVEQAFDPAPVEAEFRAIDPTLALDARCEAAVDIVQRRVASLWRILAALGGANLPGVPRDKNENRPSFLRAVATVFEPDRDQLRMEPMEAADVFARAHHRQQSSRAHGGRTEVAERDRVRDPRRHPNVHGRSTPMLMLKLLRTYLLPYRKLLFLVLVFQFVQTIMTLLLPTLNADLINKGVVQGDTEYIWKLGMVMLGVTLVQVIFAIIAIYFGARAAMSFGRDVRGALFRGVTAFSAADVNTFGASSLITRITNDVQQVQMLVVMICTLFVAAPIMIVGGLFFAIREDGPLSLILVVAIPALACSVGLVVIRLIPQFENMQNRIDRTNQVLREQITGIRVIRAFVREPEEGQRFGIANADLTQSSLAAGRLQAFMFPSVMLVLNLSSVAAVWFGADRVASGDMQIGTLIAFLTYLIQILTATMMATFVAVMWPRAAVCAARVKEVLDTAPSVAAPTTPVLEMPLRATFEMRNVHFSYPGAEEPVLNDISFRVNPGESLAVVGSTGAGKTTLLGLGPRLYDSTGGSVLVNGVDVRAVAPETLWSHIGLVPQKPYLFSGTVASNLRFGREEATDDELWEALEVAQARDFVASMPGGLDSPIAQGGTNVSGGQRQRLAIARALVKKPDIYLFDDSFSALDLATDARLRAALVPVVADAAVVIVAQRISTIIGSDQILVIDEGRAVGLGPHEVLIETCPTYVEIVESQIAQTAA